MRKNEIGYSAVEALMLVLIVSLLVGVGWYVWHAKATSTNQGTTTPISPAKPVESQAEKLYREYITPPETTETKSEITAALTNYCQTTFIEKISKSYPNKSLQATSFKVVNVSYNSNGSYRRKDAYAAVSTSCESSQISAQEKTWSGFTALLRKTDSWHVTSADQMAPDCSKVDGKGFPPEIVSTCSEGTRSRAPK